MSQSNPNIDNEKEYTFDNLEVYLESPEMADKFDNYSNKLAGITKNEMAQ